MTEQGHPRGRATWLWCTIIIVVAAFRRAITARLGGEARHPRCSRCSYWYSASGYRYWTTVPSSWLVDQAGVADDVQVWGNLRLWCSSNMCLMLARIRCRLVDSARDVFPGTIPDSEISCLTTTPTSSSRTRRVPERIDWWHRWTNVQTLINMLICHACFL